MPGNNRGFHQAERFFEITDSATENIPSAFADKGEKAV